MKAHINPLAVMAAHQKVGQEDADSIALPILLHLDAAHRGRGDANTANFLTKHILITLHLGSKSGNRSFYNIAGKAYDALRKACMRPTEVLSFTTGEYQAMRNWIGAYLRTLPGVKVGMMNFCCAKAQESLDNLDKAAA